MLQHAPGHHTDRSLFHKRFKDFPQCHRHPCPSFTGSLLLARGTKLPKNSCTLEGLALGPLRRPRYVIPRMADVEQPTLLSRWLPGALGRYFARRIRQVVMVHAVPAALSRSKAEVTLFEHRWNQYVSPGQAVYAHRGVGREMLDAARQQELVPTAVPHRKEVFG